VRRVLLAGALLLASCGQKTSTVEGPGSETSGLAARVLDSTGAPSAGLWVRAVRLDGWADARAVSAPVVLDSQRTDASGWVRFGRLPAVRVALWAEGLGGRAHAEAAVDDARAVSLRLARGASLRVRLRAGVGSVFLVGGDREAVRESDTSWVFPSLAAGRYVVAARVDSGLALAGVAVVDGRAARDTAFALDSTSVLLDDFEADWSRNRYGDLLGAGWWYTTTHPSTSAVVPSDPGSAREAGPRGTCLRFRFRPDTSSLERWALFGMDFDPPDDPGTSDLRSLRAVRFQAKGSGTLMFQIHVFGADGKSHFFWKTFQAPPDWAGVAIRVDSLVPSDSVVAWPRDAARCKGISVFAGAASELWIDDVVLDGATPWQVFPRLRGR